MAPIEAMGTMRRSEWMGVLALLAMGCSGEIGAASSRAVDGPDASRETSDGGAGPEALIRGEELWATHCRRCHGEFAAGATLSTGDAAGDFRLDAVAAIEFYGDGLEAYVDAEMPRGAEDRCVGECADAVGAYLRGLRSRAPELECGDDTIALGHRSLTLLSSREYQRSLEDLLGVTTDFGARVANTDGRRGGFVDNAGVAVSGTLLDTYVRNAAAIAAWAVARERPFACADGCAERFVEEFLPRLFRGPLPASQAAAYRELFARYGDEGIVVALETALSSPLFLYRDETGVPRAEALSLYASAPPASASPGSDPIELRTAPQFWANSDGRLDGEDWGLFENGRAVVGLTSAFVDPATVVVTARGSNHGATWPEMTLRIDGVDHDRVTVSSPDLGEYVFEVRGVAGPASVEIAFANDSGVAPYGPGEDVNLYIRSVALHAVTEPAGDPEGVVGESVLADAPADAYVLTPHQLAAALAYRLTGSTPDDELLAAATGGGLRTSAQVRAQVERLIDSRRGRERMADFVTTWFRFDAIKEVSRPDVPELTAEVKDAMLREVQEHFLHVFYSPEVPWSDFFGGDYTFLDRTLAEFYGVEGEFDETFRLVEVPGRGGPLASGAFMTVNAHAERTAPILRAVRARETALCHFIDPPNSPIAGDDIDAQRAAAQERVAAREAEAGVLSSREFYFLYTDGIDACAGCHARIINPMFGMEDFDNVGRLRRSAGPGAVWESVRGMETEVSIEGVLHGVESTSDLDSIAYAGAKDLSNQIADTEAVQSCLSRRAFRFLTGAPQVARDLDPDHREELDAYERATYPCVAERMRAAFLAEDQSPRAMFVELASDPLFLLRR